MGAYGNVPVVELAEIAQFETKNEKEWDDFHLTELDVKNQKIYNCNLDQGVSYNKG